jgi:hypothetical protein
MVQYCGVIKTQTLSMDRVGHGILGVIKTLTNLIHLSGCVGRGEKLQEISSAGICFGPPIAFQYLLPTTQSSLKKQSLWIKLD